MSLNPVTLVVLFVVLWVVILGGAGLAFWLSRRRGGVLVTGYDNNDGSRGTRRLQPDKHGNVTWRRGGRAVCSFPLDTEYAGWDPFQRIPHYFADVTPGQGRLTKRSAKGVPNDDERLEKPPKVTEWLPMPGDRLLVVAGAPHVKEINNSNNKSWEKLAVIAVIGIAVVLVLVVVGVVFTVKIWRSSGAV